MAVNLIVLAVTFMMAAFIVVWFFFPGLRAWMEMPKYRFLERQLAFPSVPGDPQRRGEQSAQPVVDLPGDSARRALNSDSKTEQRT